MVSTMAIATTYTMGKIRKIEKHFGRESTENPQQLTAAAVIIIVWFHHISARRYIPVDPDSGWTGGAHLFITSRKQFSTKKKVLCCALRVLFLSMTDDIEKCNEFSSFWTRRDQQLDLNFTRSAITKKNNNNWNPIFSCRNKTKETDKKTTTTPTRW